MTTAIDISSKVREFVPFAFTSDQEVLLHAFDNLLAVPNEKSCLILKGYAGTGKTTMLGAFVKAMELVKKRTVLLAPTGRAAKVLSLHASKPASTIHKKNLPQTARRRRWNAVCFGS
jgi:exodeoxyribonuclease-5